jgi:hypothetical protein
VRDDEFTGSTEERLKYLNAACLLYPKLEEHRHWSTHVLLSMSQNGNRAEILLGESSYSYISIRTVCK